MMLFTQMKGKEYVREKSVGICFDLGQEEEGVMRCIHPLQNDTVHPNPESSQFTFTPCRYAQANRT